MNGERKLLSLLLARDQLVVRLETLGRIVAHGDNDGSHKALCVVKSRPKWAFATQNLTVF